MRRNLVMSVIFCLIASSLVNAQSNQIPDWSIIEINDGVISCSTEDNQNQPISYCQYANRMSSIRILSNEFSIGDIVSITGFITTLPSGEKSIFPLSSIVSENGCNLSKYIAVSQKSLNSIPFAKGINFTIWGEVKGYFDDGQSIIIDDGSKIRNDQTLANNVYGIKIFGLASQGYTVGQYIQCDGTFSSYCKEVITGPEVYPVFYANTQSSIAPQYRAISGQVNLDSDTFNKKVEISCDGKIIECILDVNGIGNFSMNCPVNKTISTRLLGYKTQTKKITHGMTEVNFVLPKLPRSIDLISNILFGLVNETLEIEVLYRDSEGRSIPNATIQWTTSSGSLDEPETVTDRFGTTSVLLALPSYETEITIEVNTNDSSNIFYVNSFLDY